MTKHSNTPVALDDAELDQANGGLVSLEDLEYILKTRRPKQPTGSLSLEGLEDL